MWISWIVANRRDPGYVPQNSETYYRAIKQVILIEISNIEKKKIKIFLNMIQRDIILFFVFRYHILINGKKEMFCYRVCVIAADVSGH